MVGLRITTSAWPEVAARLDTDAIAVLPIGAGAKEHGPHLPMAADQLQAEWLVDRLVESRDVVVWPTLTYGHYPAFVDYPGSISLSRTTFTAVVAEILRGISRAGARRILILNTGISTIEPLTDVVRGAADGVVAQLVNVYAGPHLAQAQSAVVQQPWGGHADELETSILLAIAPGRVDMRRAAPAATRIDNGVFNRREPDAPNYSPTGVNGDPSLATREKGERLLQAMLRDVLDAIDTGS